MRDYTSEFLFLSILFSDLCIVYVAAYMGREYLIATVPANLLYTNFISGKLVTIFGFTTTIGNATFVGIYLASDLLCERYGKKYADTAINVGLFVLSFSIILSPLISMIEPSSHSNVIGTALTVLFDSSENIVIASVIAYFISSRVNIISYTFLRPKLKSLFIIAYVSAITGQAIDQLLFISIGFFGKVPFNVLLQMFVTGFIVKCSSAILEAFFMLRGNTNTNII